MRRGLKPCINCKAPCSGNRCRACYVKDRSENKNFNKIEWRREKLYGMVNGQFDSMWEEQKGLCKLCSKIMEAPKPGKGQGLDVVAN